MPWPWSRRTRDQELNEEIDAHLRMAVQDRMDSGESNRDARTSANREFGNIGLVKEVTRDMWGSGFLERVIRDVRFAGRILRKSPGFTAVAALTLALGIGANTAIFSVLNAVLLQPLPFAHAERLVGIFSTKTNGSLLGPSPPDLHDFAEQNQTFEKMAIYDVWRKNVSGILASSAPEQMRVGLVSADFFEVFGIQPIMGRLFTPAETEYGRHYVAAIRFEPLEESIRRRGECVGAEDSNQ